VHAGGESTLRNAILRRIEHLNWYHYRVAFAADLLARCFREGFYVRSRLIYAFRSPAPYRLGAWQASRERCLTSGVLVSDQKRFGIGEELLGLSDKSPQLRTPSVRRPTRSYLRQLKELVGF